MAAFLSLRCVSGAIKLQHKYYVTLLRSDWWNGSSAEVSSKKKKVGVAALMSTCTVSDKMDKIVDVTDVSVVPCVDSRFVQPFRVEYKQNGRQRFWDCTKIHDSIAVLIFNTTRKAFLVVRQFRPAVYMTKHRELWENSDVFSTPLSEKPTHETNTLNSSDTSGPPPAKRTALDQTREPDIESGGNEAQKSNSEYGPPLLGVTYELCAGLVDKKTSLEQIAKEEILEETGYDVPLESIEHVNSYYNSIGTAGTLQTMFYCEVSDSMMVGTGGGNRSEGEMIEVEYIPIDEAQRFIFDTSKPKSVGLCFAFQWFENVKRQALTS